MGMRPDWMSEKSFRRATHRLKDYSPGFDTDLFLQQFNAFLDPNYRLILGGCYGKGSMREAFFQALFFGLITLTDLL
jgi:hypothetical protein